MATKLGKGEYPTVNGSKTIASDFKCYGPSASKDTEFEKAYMADMGCFNQEGVDSNKYYSVCMCTHKITGGWYVYVEYGREGIGKPQYQWFQCCNESDARKTFQQRCDEKNTKRGEWSTVGGHSIFVAKPKKDLYRVRQLAKRSYGLPDGYNIASEGYMPQNVTKSKKTKSNNYKCDPITTQMIRDLLGGAVTYTKTSIQGGNIPVQQAIDDARILLDVAKDRLAVVGDDVDDQINDKELKETTYALYSRIPKVKSLHTPEKDWILSKNNIFLWEQDLTAFETALTAGTIDHIQCDDPMADYPVDMSWIDPKSDLGKWLYAWWPNATRNKHQNMGKMVIKNLWKIDRHGDLTSFDKNVLEINGTIKKPIIERPLHQDKNRSDLDENKRNLYLSTNVGLLFHASRSVNIPSIIKTNLRLPSQLKNVVLNGAAFGGGIYGADDWKKSAGYASLENAYWSKGTGGVKGRGGFMFGVDMILGLTHIAPHSRGYTEPPKGCHSVFAKAGQTSYIQNNEWIVYQSNRFNIRYLVEFTAK